MFNGFPGGFAPPGNAPPHSHPGAFHPNLDDGFRAPTGFLTLQEVVELADAFSRHQLQTNQQNRNSMNGLPPNARFRGARDADKFLSVSMVGMVTSPVLAVPSRTSGSDLKITLYLTDASLSRASAARGGDTGYSHDLQVIFFLPYAENFIPMAAGDILCLHNASLSSKTERPQITVNKISGSAWTVLRAYPLLPPLRVTQQPQQ